jgi:hypothetical protein
VSDAEIVIVGAGAAGLMSAIAAGRALRASGASGRVLVLDGARTLGAKILVAGGGRCNVTHHAVDESAYAGSSRHAVRKVLGRFSVERTVEFFRDLGVELKREETGKLFPTTDSARTVLEALLRAAREAGVRIEHPRRVLTVGRDGAGFELSSEAGPVKCSRLILATGGKSLPRTGSDGAGYDMARALGHTTTPSIFPALVPLLLPREHWVCGLSGIAVEATLCVRSSGGKKLMCFSNPVLLTHFGLSGPAVLDISRHVASARETDAGATLVAQWVVGLTPQACDAELQKLGTQTPQRWLETRGLPDRLARALCEQAGVLPGVTGATLSREQRRGLVAMVCECVLPVTGDRGWLFAEVTAGGVPLDQLRLETLESRVCPGLHMCGEILDVDGRVGGFNFQWAWASGFVAGNAAARAVAAPA